MMQLHNVLRSGYTFEPSEYELETKYILVNSSAMVLGLVMLIKFFLYSTIDDRISAELSLYTVVLVLIAMVIARILPKKYFIVYMYIVAFIFAAYIMYNYYERPDHHDATGWVVLEIIVFFLILDIYTCLAIAFLYTGFSLYMYFMVFEHAALKYLISQLTPVYVSLMVLSVIENKYRRALTLLEDANKAKSIFFASMSHEIRTPLNGIIGFSKILANSSKLSLQDSKHAKIIQSSASSLLEIINDVLDLSKIENGNFEIHPVECSLYDVSKEVIELFSARARDKEIHLIAHIDHSINGKIIADDIRLKQVLYNLISNAIKFTPHQGKVVLNVRLLSKDKDTIEVNFEVKDNGMGIPKEKQKYIFDPYIQIDGESNRQLKGTGLGLSICSHLVQAMGGEIMLESEVGIGSRFYFSLFFPLSQKFEKRPNPYTFSFKVEEKDHVLIQQALLHLKLLGEEANIDEAPELCIRTSNLPKSSCQDLPAIVLFSNEHEMRGYQPTKDEVTISQPFYPSKFHYALEMLGERVPKRLKKKKVSASEKLPEGTHLLVAEDNPDNQELILYYLEQLEVGFEIVNNGKEAFEAFRNDTFDLILMDINMPVINGLEALKKIREYEKKEGKEHIPVIALTANAMKEECEYLIKEGMNGYLSKPIDFDALKEIIMRHLSAAYQSMGASNHDKPLQHILGSDISYFNIEAIRKRFDIDEKLAKLFIDRFKSDIDKEMQKLKDAINKRDGEAVRFQAHYIKNMCLNITFDQAAELLQRIEDDARSRSVNEALYSDLVTLMQKALKK